VNGSPNPLDTGRGRFIPTDPVDRYIDDMLSWYGMDPADIGSVAGGTNVILPNRLSFPAGIWNIVA
jgi:hypothetical protein